MSKPWNDWYHCMGSTYGTWLYGDARGFRTRHHREHVEGDYRDPPPSGMYEPIARRSAESMRTPVVTLSPDDRIVVCRAMGDRLLDYRVELVDLAVGGKHFHLLARFPRTLELRKGAGPPANLLRDGRNPIPRHILGRAKRAASLAMTRLGRKPEGHSLWARRAKTLPIRGRGHQLAVVRYIRSHARQGAVVWSRLPPTRGA
jgi:hypothetical protein